MIIHAVSIHSGGGKVLLDQLLKEKTFGEVKILICDSRYQLPEHLNPDLEIFKIKASLKERFKAENLLKKLSGKSPQSQVLCFSNLPPVFKLKGKVILYLQNALLLPGAPHFHENFKTALRFSYEKIWLNLFWHNVDEVWVQTQWMKRRLEQTKLTPVKIVPIVLSLPAPRNDLDKIYDFITVTGSAPHKKLLKLLQSWNKLSPPYPRLLIVTDSPTSAISRELELAKSKNVTVKMGISREEMLELYNQSKVLIITSQTESYCLPIYEAKHFNLKIIAPDEDYVKEACTPQYVTDPDDPDFMEKIIRSQIL